MKKEELLTEPTVENVKLSLNRASKKETEGALILLEKVFDLIGPEIKGNRNFKANYIKLKPKFNILVNTREYKRVIGKIEKGLKSRNDNSKRSGRKRVNGKGLPQKGI